MKTKCTCLSSQSRKRLQGAELILKGYNNDQIADILDVTTRSVQNWRNKLKEHNNNITCLRRKHGSGQSPLLDEKQKQQLKQIIVEGARKAGYTAERWTSNIVANLILKTFSITMAPRTVRDLLPTLGLSPQMPVVKSHKHNDEEVLRWATQQWSRIKKSEKTRYSLSIIG